MKAPSLLLFAGLFLFLSCQPRPSAKSIDAATSSPPACNQPGTALRSTLDDTTRGYAYNFQVYLPPCYDSEIDRYYPVLYLIPGRGSGPDAWFTAGVDKIADGLILGGQIPPFIIITTENTDTDPYADIIHEELIPYVESVYRIQADGKRRAVAGGSLGGVGAYRLAFRFPNQFGSVGMFGSGLISGEESQVQAWLTAVPTESRPRLFFNCGIEDFLMLERAEAMITLLERMDIRSTSIFSEGGHNYDYWVSNFPDYFRWLAKDW